MSRNLPPQEEVDIRNEVEGDTPNKGIKKYVASPTLADFHASVKRFRMVKGPVGSGKSVGCIMELLMRALMQKPYNGVRSTRWLITRKTYPQLKSTTIKTFSRWIPSNVCPIVYDTPIRGRIEQKLSDGTKLDMEILFMALENDDDIEKLKSLDLTGAYVNEISEFDDQELLTTLRGRVGRFPEMSEGGPTWRGVVADTNPPPVTHWLYELFETGKVPEGFELFTQPPAVYFDDDKGEWRLNPEAENLANLPEGYYEDQINGASEDYIRVMLAGEYGMMRHGKPVFPKFSEAKHVASQIIMPHRGMPLLLGFDFGLNPACIFAQLGSLGRLNILDELVPADESFEEFVHSYVVPLINKKYSGFRIRAVGDPAGRGRSGLDKRTPFDVLKAVGINAKPAPTNSFIPRKEAVDWFLDRDGKLMVSPNCTYIREAFVGGYVYDEIKGTKETKNTPKKNKFSHGMDAVQYIALDVRSGQAAVRESTPREQVAVRYV